MMILPSLFLTRRKVVKIKTRAMWYLALFLIIFGSLIMSVFNHFLGLIIMVSSAYLAGGYQVLCRFEDGSSG